MENGEIILRYNNQYILGHITEITLTSGPPSPLYSIGPNGITVLPTVQMVNCTLYIAGMCGGLEESGDLAFAFKMAWESLKSQIERE